MLHKPTPSYNKITVSNNRSIPAKNSTVQHGLHQNNNKKSLHRIAFLLSIPSESLTHITSFLDPASLLTLVRTNKQLYDHINDDNVWHRAFLCQFLGIGPENDIHDIKSLMLRRTEPSWKREFILRFNLRMRWEKSRASTVTHSPLNSAITSIHLISENGMLTSSIQYGVVSRSHPLTGKVFRGYLDAAGTSNGLGIGNPNAEFSPDVSICRFASEGGTAKMLWGFRNGQVAVTIANRVMHSSRTSGAKFTRCLATEEHNGMVVDAVWGTGGNVFVSGGVDGRVKLWDGKMVRCLWTSEVQEMESVSKPCTKVSFDSGHGVIAVASNGGDIVIWFGLASLYAAQSNADLISSCVPEGIVIPVLPIAASGDSHTSQPKELTTFVLHHQSDSLLSLLTNRIDDSYFYRYTLDSSSHSVVDTVRFGEGYNGAICCTKLCISCDANESSFVLVGDRLGCLSVYNWDAPSSDSAIPPIKRLDAYDDGSSITAIEWNPTILITGSSSGMIRVWDSLTFTLLRSFVSPLSKPRRGEWESVTQVILEREMLVVAMGDKVMSWKAGPIRKAGSKIVAHGGKQGKNNNLAKWRHQVELHRDIVESKRDLEQEHNHRQQAFWREQNQQGSLNALGLNEQEALEYVLMLSRDEEEARHHTEHPDSSRVERDFEVTSGDSSGAPSPLPSLARTPPRSLSDAKIQISPGWPVAAGLGASIGRSISIQSIDPSSVASTSANDGFPTMKSNASSVSSASTASTSKTSAVGSPKSLKSAWSAPIKRLSPSPPAASPPKISGVTSGLDTCGNAHPIGPKLPCEVTDEDRDLRYAIELSLAEAKSKCETELDH